MRTTMTLFTVGIFLLSVTGCHKNNSTTSVNHAPVASISSNLLSVNPFTYEFKVEAFDQEFDPLQYTWDFGDGTERKGNAVESYTFEDGRQYIIKVTVTDGNSQPVVLRDTIDTKVIPLKADKSTKFQTMEGFGGFGTQKEPWGTGPFTSPEFVNMLINDLGLTILRMDIPANFEIPNDNDDPFVTDLSKFNVNNNTPGYDEKLADYIPYLKDMKAAGLQKLIVSLWSPPVWMKYSNQLGNGTKENSAPEYTNNPGSNTNQLKTNMYDEFAEFCVAYIKTIKNLTGIDVYAFSLQNEPRFSQFYASCVYNGAALRDLIKVVGARFEKENISAKIFLPEDVGWYDGIKSLVDPVLADPDARKYVSILAVHGYATDGVSPGSSDAQTWRNMYNWGKPWNIPLWMTETSGYENNLTGAIALAKAMYIALKYGNVSAWVFWTLSTNKIDAYSLMNTSGEKSKRYFVSKNFYRYIRPGSVRFDITGTDAHLLPLAFSNSDNNSTTIVIINDDVSGKAFQITGEGLPVTFDSFITNESKDCADNGAVEINKTILIPAQSVLTLRSKN